MERIINKLKVSKKNIICFILGAIIFSAISVYAATYFPSNQVTYDNRTSGLSSTNVQGAIDELYNTCSSAVSSGDYLYYAVNRYARANTYAPPYGGTLYRCNADGGGCVTVSSADSGSSIAAIYGNSKYMYYAVNRYARDISYALPYVGTLYRCSADGGGCVTVSSVGSGSSIAAIYGNSKYMYYAVSRYAQDNSYALPYGGTLYRCNLDGSSCTSINTISGFSSFG